MRHFSETQLTESDLKYLIQIRKGVCWGYGIANALGIKQPPALQGLKILMRKGILRKAGDPSDTTLRPLKRQVYVINENVLEQRLNELMEMIELTRKKPGGI